MGVGISNGSLDFVSTLNNSDYQAKIQQDIRATQILLQLTGDTTGIEKYNEAVKASLQSEVKLRADLDKILQDAQIKTEELIATVSKPVSKTVFSDSALEVQAYIESLNGLESGASIVAGLNAQLDELAVKQNLLTDSFNQGTISEVAYAEQMQVINSEQIRLVESIERVNAAFSEGIIVENQNVQASEKTVAAVEQEVNAYHELALTLKELKAARANPLTPTTDLPIINKQIQETEANIKRFSNVGKVGFDELGNQIEQTTTKSGKFASAVSRVTNLQSIGARVVTQFSRQIIGLGVGFISLEIGAKAIKSLIDYISNLDIFTGRLDQATQNVAAFNEIQKETVDAVGKQIEPLRVLYDATQNLTKSTQDRVKAANELRDLYPAEFQNSSALAIINGQVKKSYDDLTTSIIENAKSAAAQTQIAKLSGDILNAQIQIQKINNAKAAETHRVFAQEDDQASNLSDEQKIQQINQRALESIEDQKKLIAVRTGTIRLLEGYVKNVTSTATEIDNANKLLGDNLQNFDHLISNYTDKQQLLNIQKALQTKLNSLAPSDAQFGKLKEDLQRVDDLLKKYNVKATTTTTDPAIALLAQQTKVLQDIEALNQKTASKAKTRDEQAVDDVIATYNKQFEAAVAFNTKLAQFKKDHPGDRSPSANKLFAIDTSQIDLAKINALEALAGTQSVENTKNQVDQQKAVFKEYEAFKLQAGTEAANELFGKELKGYENYIEFLKGLQPKESDLTSADPYTKARASALQDFIKVELPKAQNDEFVLTQKHLQDLIIQDQDFLQKRQTLIEKANEDIALLQSKGFTDQADQVKKNLQDELTALDETNFKKLESYKQLFENIDNISTRQAKKQLSDLRDTADQLFLSGNLTLDAYNKIVKTLNQAGDAIDNKIASGLKNVGSELTNIGGQVDAFDASLGKAFKTVGSIVSGLGGIKSGLAALKLAQGNNDSLGAVTAGLGIFGSAIGIITTVVSLFDHSKQIAAQMQYAEQLQVKSIEAINKQLERQLELTKQVYGPQRITAYLSQLADIKVAEGDIQNQINGQLQLTGNKILDDVITKSNANQNLTTTEKKILQGIQEAYAKLGDSVNLAGKSIEQLQQLLDQGKLSDKTAALVQSLIDLQKQAIDTQNALQGDLLGTNFDSLLSNIDDLFTSATTSAEDFAANFQSIIQKALLNSFNRQFLEQQLQKFYNDFFAISQASPNNIISKEDIAKLQAEYNDIIANAQGQFKNIENITGQVLTNPTTSGSQSSLSGAIQQAITENTATEIVGTLHGIQLGIFDVNKSFGQLMMIAQDQLTAALEIQVNTKRTADNSDTLPGILEELKSITINTAGTLNTELRALGLN